jgi:hypothetical protein
MPSHPRRLEFSKHNSYNHMDWQREIRGQIFTDFRERNGLVITTHGLKSLRENCTPGKQQEIKINIS